MNLSKIILLIDMDCFFCQVEENLNPVWKGKPLAVVQYNPYRGGGIIAVNYPARAQGVTRHMRGDEAKKKCPDIILARVPEQRGKANTSKYRDAGKRVADVLQTFTPLMERASVDEAYLDITEPVEKRLHEKISLSQLSNTHIVGSSTEDFLENVTIHRMFDENNFKLAIGAVIAEEIRLKVFETTGYTCSAGVAHNKILAKLVCGLNKPNKQTVLPHEAVPVLYQDMPVKKVRSLGGKFGDQVVEKLGIQFMGELSRFSEKELIAQFDSKSGSWLYNIARGFDSEPVNTRLVAKSIGCCKQFPGRSALCTKEDIQHWLSELAEEVCERLEKDMEENSRRARQMVVNFANDNVQSSKSHPLSSYDKNRMVENALNIIQNNCLKNGCRVTFLGISAGQFQEYNKRKEITTFFKVMQQKIDVQEEDGSDDSIYSKTTEEDLEEREDLTYYEQVFPQSIQTKDDKSDISEDSISGELDTPLEPQESFFIKFFNQREELQHKETNFEEQLDKVVEVISKISETCPECNKTVDIAEYQSHLDYHFALSIVKSETPPSGSTVKSQKKGTKPILDYFRAGPSMQNTEGCEKCTECNKFIPIDEYETHLDYHLAQKLRMEEFKPKKKTASNHKGSLLGFLRS